MKPDQRALGGRAIAWARATSRSHINSVRSSQRANAIATSSIRWLLTVLKARPDFFLLHLPRTGEVRSRLPNGRRLVLWTAGDDNIANRVYWRGWAGHEPEVMPLYFQMSRRAEVVLDIGSFNGIYALVASLANRGGRVFAFEPLPNNHERLLRNVRLNAANNVECVSKAVGAYEGMAVLFAPVTGLSSSASLSREFLARKAVEIRSIDVAIVTIDEFAEQNGLDRVDLIKVDTETTEADVLFGMEQTLERDHPSIFCEVLVGTDPASIEERLSPLGYRYYHLRPEGPRLASSIRGHPKWKNYLLTTLQPAQLDQLAKGREGTRPEGSIVPA